MTREEAIEKYNKDKDLSCADLSCADLRGANLHYADLCGANLRDADLFGANLFGANLRDADLRDADLFGANLFGANLRDADLFGANLCGANLRDADLHYADLCGANLRDADLHYANLRGANLCDAKSISAYVTATTLVCPETGAFEGWKKCSDGVLVRVRIAAKTPRSSATGRKCRAERVTVLEVIGAEYGISIHDNKTKYVKGKTVKCDNWCEDRWQECAGGIHFFMTRYEAEHYNV